MKKRRLKKFFLMIGIVVFALLTNNCVYAKEQHWKSLDYNVTVNSDGSMDVVETWNISVYDTNTLFKDFEVDESQYSSISNVRVVDFTGGIEKNLTQIYEEQYHVDSGCYYAMILPSNSSKYEIAWNIGADDKSLNKVYKIYYTVNDVVKIYKDCAELYWQFLGTDNAIDGKTITGTITLPKEVSDIEKLRVWAHGDLSGEINKMSRKKVYFYLPSIDTNTMLEIRVVTDENIYDNCTKKINKNKLEKILKEETKWADKANKKRYLYNNIDTIVPLFIIGIIVLINVPLCILFLKKMFMYINEGKKLEEECEIRENDIQYFRDIPDEENATPARASYMYNFRVNSSNINKSNVFSATLLDLAFKKIISFELMDKNNVKITFLNNLAAESAIRDLSSDERPIYELIKSASQNKDCISIKEFNKYSRKHYDYFFNKINNIEEKAEYYAERCHYMNQANKKESKEWSKKANAYLIFGIFTLFFNIFIPVAILLLICSLICRKNASKIQVLTEKGYQVHYQWKGLKKYMKEFSLLKDREVPDLILWEKYLVYATTFGISKKVLEQLKVVYPELNDPNYLYGSEYSYMNFIANSSIDEFNNLTNSFNKVYYTASNAYNAAHSSSGSGGGGGFSSGGGGGRTEEAAVEDVKIMIDLKKEIQYIKGVGPTRAKLLNKIGIANLEDLITYFPREYEDRSKPKNIAEVENDEEVLISAYPVGRMNEIRIRGNLCLDKLIVRDETGTAQIVWYNQSYLKNVFKPNQRYKFYGKIKNNRGKIEMQSPVYEEESSEKNTGRIIPIYPLTYSLTQNTIRKIIESGLAEVDGNIPETMPKYFLDKYGLYDINTAIHQIHFPENFDNFEKARKRLVFEELLSMQLSLLSLKNKYGTTKKGIAFDEDAKMSDVINDLPFKLTNAQLRVLEEIDNDMEIAKPMNRLLQGDVGSGKTIVAMIACYKAVKSGYQAVVMAPTAILATQHLESFTEILDKYGIKSELLVSGISKKKKEDILHRLENGEIDILIGTHAVLEENVKFSKLGLVVTDEQHRFGVRQRTIITEKGDNPDVLVMTATPIPRTLALILYGDLDISIIDELPPNRKKIETYAVTKGMEARVNAFIAKNIDEGRQCYIVCPLVEENEEIDAKSVMELVEEYKNHIFSQYKVEYLHGKMRPKEKDEIMERFKNGDIDILISTTVIEVGVNVPNSNIMVIENAERFGLAQLHQLRGRVGRGEYQSYCILKYQGKSDVVKQRMEVISKSNDGFVISEKDLELRGSGEFFGTKQHGIPEFKIANLFEDIGLLKTIQGIAIQIIDNDPLLEKEENKEFRRLIEKNLDRFTM